MKKKKLQIFSKEKNLAVLRVIGKILAWALGVVVAVVVALFIYVNLPVSSASGADAKLGVTFSSRYASDIGLDWKQAYVSMLDDLKVRNIRVPVYWDLAEPAEGQYDFSDIDWQLEQARQRDAKIILVVGRKVPRWPECFIPKWAGDNTDVQQQKLLDFEDVVIRRYKDGHPEIANWQVENEPFLDFGICPTVDNAKLLDAEIAKVKSIDASKPIIVTDSGELSLWLNAANRADVFGTTMYREVYSSRQFFGKPLGHWNYPIGPNFFKLKQLFIRLFAHQNNAIVIELQGEPWVQGWTTSAPIDTQLASMNAAKLADNVQFAKETGMKEIFLWGVEWWYWMKVQQNNPTLWEQAKTLFQQ
ncbi:MAG TPA: hypothetical protein VF817_04050, partial [Patescibacteria group bacterium]